MNHAILSVVILVGLLFASRAQATLYDRGGGLLYDDVLNITWLQDANYAKTSGYDITGALSFADAVTWAENLVYHDSVRNVDYSDWRLPTVSPVGADWNIAFSFDGSTDIGYNITSTASEMSFMYYVNLGLKGYYSPAGVYQNDFGMYGNGTTDELGGHQNNVGLVQNLQNYYWSGTLSPWYTPAQDTAVIFLPIWGRQAVQGLGQPYFAWAVRDGDVAAVPEPVFIDIEPGSFPNSINPKSNGVIPVAILTTNTFDATTVDPLSVKFGPDGATEAHGRGHREDVNGDGKKDLVLHFRTQDTGIVCGDTSASLTGETFSGQAIEGSDSLRTVGCKKIGEHTRDHGDDHDRGNHKRGHGDNDDNDRDKHKEKEKAKGKR